jgi:hypothetical protein
MRSHRDKRWKRFVASCLSFGFWLIAAYVAKLTRSFDEAALTQSCRSRSASNTT